jgi:hypothetical protein
MRRLRLGERRGASTDMADGCGGINGVWMRQSSVVMCFWFSWLAGADRMRVRACLCVCVCMRHVGTSLCTHMPHTYRYIPTSREIDMEAVEISLGRGSATLISEVSRGSAIRPALGSWEEEDECLNTCMKLVLGSRSGLGRARAGRTIAREARTLALLPLER